MYSASASLPKNSSPCGVLASFFWMNQSGSAPIIFSGIGSGWMLNSQCQEKRPHSRVMLLSR